MPFLYKWNLVSVEDLEAKGDLNGLIAGLRCKDDHFIQEAAAEAIGRLCDPNAADGEDPFHTAIREGAVGPLCEALQTRGRGKSANDDFVPSLVRAAAADALGILRNGKALKPLCAALQDNEKKVRRAAAGALWRLGDARALESLIEALKDADEEVQRFAALALGDFHDPRAVEPLCAALRHPLPAVRDAAAASLGALGDQRAFDALSDALLRGSARAASALAAVGDRRAVEPLRAALADLSGEALDAAAAELAKFGDPDSFDALSGALKKGSAPAVPALVAAGGRRAVEPLCAEVIRQKLNNDLRLAAVNALAAFNDPCVVGPLCAALAESLADSGKMISPSPHPVRRAIARALGMLGDRRAVEPLCAALKDDFMEVRTAAVDALAELGDPLAIQPLCEWITSDPKECQEIHYASNQYSTSRDQLGPLLKAAENAKKAAVRSLGKMGAPGTAEFLEKLLADGKYSPLHAAAGEALARLKKRAENVPEPAGAHSDFAAGDLAEEFHKRDIAEHRTVYTGADPRERPAKGAFVIVSEEAAGEMRRALVANGLGAFAAGIGWVFSCKPVSISANPLHIEGMPVECEMAMCNPVRAGGSFTLAGRIVVEDPCFLDGRGNPAAAELPAIYCEQVLKAFNPFEAFRSFSPFFNDMLLRAGANAQFFKDVLVETAKKWKNKPAPGDAGTLERTAALAILHEAAHFLINHMPDGMSILPPGEAARRAAFSAARYQEIVNATAGESLSVVFAKNAFKALRSCLDKEPGKETEQGIVMIVLIETFCDRFSCFLYENHLKRRIYQSILPSGEEHASILDQLELENRRRADPSGFSRDHPEVKPEILSALDRAETAHVYMEAYGDPPLTNAERAFFGGFLELLVGHDREGTILQFSPAHVSTSRVIQPLLSGLISKAE
jgi:HEAT repeat protein